MKYLFQWISPYIFPPRWMAFAFYSARRNQALFAIPPLNLLIVVAWWLQDKWARKAMASSWIEEEVERRLQQEIRRYR